MLKGLFTLLEVVWFQRVHSKEVSLHVLSPDNFVCLRQWIKVFFLCLHYGDCMVIPLGSATLIKWMALAHWKNGPLTMLKYFEWHGTLTLRHNESLHMFFRYFFSDFPIILAMNNFFKKISCPLIVLVVRTPWMCSVQRDLWGISHVPTREDVSHFIHHLHS